MAHVDEYVITDVIVTPRSELQPRKRGVLFRYRPSFSRTGALKLVEESRSPLFVDPRTGMLRETHARTHRKQMARTANATRASEQAQTLRVIDATHQLRRFNEVWYEVTIAPIPGAPLREWQKQRMKPDEKQKLTKVWCVLEKRLLSRFDADTYVTSKRQLNSKEIAGHQLGKSAM